MASRSIAQYELRRPLKDAEGKPVLDPETGKRIYEKTGEVVWRARYRDAAGKEHAKHFKLKKAAKDWLDGVTTSVNTGSYVDPKKAKTTFEVLASGWVAKGGNGRSKWKISTKTTNEALLRIHVLPKWGKAQVGRIELEDVQKWVNDLGETELSPASIRKIFFVFTGVLRHAVTMKTLKVMPSEGVTLPSTEAASTTDDEDEVGVRRYLSPGEVEALAEAAGEGRLVVLTLAYTGLRWGEMAALKVRNVDLDRGRLWVVRSVTEINGELVWSTPKDKKGRSVPMPEFLRDEIKTLIEGKGDDELVFTATRGGVLRNRAARRAWFDGAVLEQDLVGLTPHGLRHTAASIAIHSGATVLTVQRMLGHAKPSITLDVYADLFDDDLDAVAARMHTARTESFADFLRTQAQIDASQLAS